MLSLALLLLASPAQAKQLPDSSEAFVAQCREAADCELRFFTELSKTFRPSRKEDELHDYILAVEKTAEDTVWKHKLDVSTDSMGNILIRLPATGAFLGRNAPYFALQSHMDMVLAYADAKPGENIEPYFKDGVALEVTDGWLHSKDYKTTLGADNGIGVAFALRYLIDERIAHPPLELVFTVQEEIGLFGASGFGMPLYSRRMLCLDGMTPEEGMIIAGSQGGHSEVLHFNAKATDLSHAGQDQVLTVTVTKLAGGHSGGDIWRGRMNAIKLVGELYAKLAEDGTPVRVKSLLAGDGVINKIPSLFRTEIVLPASAADAGLPDRVKTFLLSRISQNEDDALNAEVVATVAPAQDGATGGAEFAKLLAGAISAAPNGVIDSDPTYFHSIYTSNNLSYLNLAVTRSGALTGELGFMARSFSSRRMNEIATTVDGGFSAPTFTTNFRRDVLSGYDAWMEPETSVLMSDVLTRSGYFSRKFFLNAGLEPSAFKQKYPDLEVVALGPLTLYAHSVKEQLKLDSIPRTVEGVRKIVQLGM